ncbi:Disks large 3 [Cichlidogyrus casuarinus]|uniref:Disks large 3 n=1 Tax=Cichlidogyrus casuarinus TaxID=1844966 RepID=A0ABD2PNM6_9PLAT
MGIIPGKIRVERRNRLRAKRVDFSNNNYIIGSNPSENIHQWNSVNEKLDSIGNEKQLEIRNQSLDRYKQCKTVYPTHHDHGNSSFMKRISERIGRRGTYTLSKGINGRSVEDNLKTMGTTGDLNIYKKSRSYEVVAKTNIHTSCRPVILLGPLKEQVSTKLLEETSLFSACVSRELTIDCNDLVFSALTDTSRPKGPDEVDGEDFYFVPKEELLKDIEKGDFIEHCESRGHIYGISAEAIKKILHRNVVCLLEVSCSAIPNMQLYDLHPFVILLMPESLSQLSLVISRYTDEQADRTFKKCKTLLDENSHLISAVVPLKSLDQTVTCVKGLVDAHCRSSTIWMGKPIMDPSADVPSWRKDSQSGRRMQKELAGSLSPSQKAFEAI